MLSKKVKERIHQQGLINDLTALGTFLTGNKPVSVSYEEYKDRFLRIMELDRKFLELYTQAEFKVSLQNLIKVLYCTFGINSLISLLAFGEIHLFFAIITIPVGLVPGNGLSKILPKNELERTLEGIRREMQIAGGPHLGGMRRIIKAGLESGKSE